MSRDPKRQVDVVEKRQVGVTLNVKMLHGGDLNPMSIYDELAVRKCAAKAYLDPSSMCVLRMMQDSHGEGRKELFSCCNHQLKRKRNIVGIFFKWTDNLKLCKYLPIPILPLIYCSSLLIKCISGFYVKELKVKLVVCTWTEL